MDAQIFLLIITIYISIITAIFLLRDEHHHRAPSGASYLSWLNLAILLWSGSEILRATIIHLPASIFLQNISQSIFVLLPLFWLAFVQINTSESNTLQPERFIPFLLLPGLTLLAIWTNDYHLMYWRDYYVIHSSPFRYLVASVGPWYFVNLLYSASIFILSIIWIGKHTGTTRTYARKQSLIFMFGLILPYLMNLIYALQWLTDLHIDPTPFGFSLVIPVFTFGLIRNRGMRLLRSTRDKLLNDISDGMIVLDQQNRIVELNTAASAILGKNTSDIIGMDILDALPALDSWIGMNRVETWQQPEVQIDKDDTPRFYSLRMSALLEDNQSTAGRLIILRNITRRKQSEIAEREAREKAESRAIELENLRKLAETLNQASTVSETARTSIATVIALTHAHKGWLLLRDVKSVHGLTLFMHPQLQQTDPPLSIHCQSCPTFRDVLGESDTPQLISSCAVRESIMGNHQTSLSQVSIPLHMRAKFFGTLNLIIEPIEQLDNEMQRLYTTIGEQFSAALDRTHLFEEIQQQAITDPLTGAFNRRHFFYLAEREVRRAKRMQSPLSAIMIDLDYFKKVNDTYGHLIGDLVLKEVTTRIANSLRQIDLLGRYGGEEFCLLLPGCDEKTAQQVAERLREEISNTPIQTNRGEISISASFGVGEYLLSSSRTIETLIQHADDGLYQAKSNGRNQVVLVDTTFMKRHQPVSEKSHQKAITPDDQSEE